MDPKKFRFWQKWLTYANLMAVVVGVLCAFAGNSFVFEIHNDYTKDVYFGGAEFDPAVLEMKNWLFGIIGGTIVGFHILMILISENAFKKKERWGYLAMWFAMISWFCIDSSVSLFYGAIHNVVLINIFSFVMIVIPLIVCRKEFKTR